MLTLIAICLSLAALVSAHALRIRLKKLEQKLEQKLSNLTDYQLLFGTPGEKGASGEQGKQGDQGEKGDQGNQGLPGVEGERGVTGERGIAAFTEPVPTPVKVTKPPEA